MGSSLEVYNSWKQSRKFSYANVRKAAYRGSPTIIINKIFHMISVFKFCVIWGIFLTWFADSLLFDMMLKTSYQAFPFSIFFATMMEAVRDCRRRWRPGMAAGR